MILDPSTLAWNKNGDNLLPVVIQHAETGQVLMLGSMNAEALRKTQETGFVTFYSRSKKRLWQKGETSGNHLKVVSIASDCDGDAILVRAVPSGPTCHIGRRSCFAVEESAVETIGILIEIIRARAATRSKGSYTRQLLDGGIAAYGAKVLEEAGEVVHAARNEGKKRTVEEAADLLYHLFVLLRGERVELEDIALELRKRRKQ